MKNPFKKDKHTALIAAVAIGTVAAGVIAFLFLTEKGDDARRSLKKKIRSIAKNAVVEAISKKSRIKKKAVKAVGDHVVK